MQSSLETTPISTKQLWAGRLLGGVPALFLLTNAVVTLLKLGPVVEGTTKLGYAESVITPLGLTLLLCTLLYLFPRTALLGAILLTGYLGGAVATHLRAGDGWFPLLFPVGFGVLLWGGLYLRDERLHALLPLRR